MLVFMTRPRISLASLLLLAAAMPMGGECYWTIEDTGAWADDPTAMSHFGPILVPRTASATGGGGLLTHPGWSGGMRG